jgi:hypothetical protein
MAQFAGSRSLDERRRRRLATESDEAHAETPTTPIPRRVSGVKSPAKSRGPGHFPLRKVISARLWKHSAIGLGGSLLAAGIVLGGWAAQVHSDRLGPGFAWLFNLSAAHLVRWYVATAIYLTSQLALLIWWLRSQSLQDFKGGYRGWAGCAAIGLFAAFAIQTNALRAWTETAHWLWHIDGKRQSLSWLGPVALCGLIGWRFLYREMRDCLASRALLWLAGLLGAAALVPMVGGPFPIPALSLRMTQCGLAMLAVLCLFMSFLFQARHAIYITVEPPAERPAWFVALWRRYRGRAASSSPAAPAMKPAKEIVAKAARPRRPKRDAASNKATEAPAKPSQPSTEEAQPLPLQNAKQAARLERRALRRSA